MNETTNGIKVVAGIKLEDLPDKPSCLRYLEGFYCRRGEPGLRYLGQGLSHEMLAVLFLRAFDYDQKHPEPCPDSTVINLSPIDWAQFGGKTRLLSEKLKEDTHG